MICLEIALDTEVLFDSMRILGHNVVSGVVVVVSREDVLMTYYLSGTDLFSG